jgi:diaminobutyrate-2-oxoglutarate transaminase
MEAIQGEGGVNPMSAHSLREIRRITSERGIPLVIDEVQAGFCRSGKFFAYEHAGIVPDVVCLSKAVGGGQPLAVLAYKEALDRWSPGAHTGTFRGNQIAFVAGKSSIDFMVENKLWEHAQSRGDQLQQRLKQIQEDSSVSHGCIGHVRGRGLMVG